MAQWWEVLSRVDIFRDFLKDGKSEGSGLLTSTESDLLLWIEERKCVLAINLRKLHMQLQNEDVDAVEWPEVFYQLLLCSKEPLYTVHRIQVSPKGESLLLEGISNLMVMKMLKRRGLRGEYGGGHKEVVCATFVVEVYAENQSNIIRRMEWLNEKEFIVLSSDNVLRKFSTALPTQPVLSIGLSETVSSFPSVSAPGLDWIDFSILDHSTLVCLRDSGEVQILRLNNPNGVELSDALPMFPSAQDNYTSDASVLLVLQTALPIVVIATPTGEMHHCIMLPKTESSGVPTECLVVYERLHLESDVVHDYGAIQLLPDPTSPNGYFIQHQLGVHRVLLPWAERMNMFMSSEDCSNVSPVEGQADIQYLLDVATSNTDLTRTPALCGVSVTWDTIIGNSLVCIASDGTCVVFLLQPAVAQSTNEGKEEPQQTTESPRTPTSSQKSNKSNFVKQIAGQLKRNGDTALHHIDVQKTKTQEGCYRAIRQSTKLLTEDCLSKQDLALIELDVKKKFLISFHQQQIDQVEDLREDVEEEQDRFQRICEKLQLAQLKGEELLKRLRQVVCTLSTRSSELSNEEKKFQRLMQRMNVDLEKMDTRILMLKAKCKTVGYDLDKPPTPPTMTDSQLEYTRSVLEEQMSTISQIISNVKVLKASMSVVPGEEDEELLDDLP